MGSKLGSAGKALSEAERVAAEVSREFAEKGIRHALVGGLAVVAHGYARSTADVDLIVLDPTRVTGTPLGIPGVTFTREGVPVDVMFAEKNEGFLHAAVFEAEGEPPVLTFPALVYLKLKAGRMKDLADVVELLKANPEKVDVTGHWLSRHAPVWVRWKFDHVVKLAETER